MEGVTEAGHEIAHAVSDLGDLDYHLREVEVQVPHRGHFHEMLEHHVDIIEMGNDTILGGGGNDLIVGDAFVTRTVTALLVPGGMTWNYGKDDAWQDNDWKDKYGLDDLPHHHHHHDHDDDDDDHDNASGIRVGADTISGDGGVDLIWGDNLALISSAVMRGAGLGNNDFKKARKETEDGLDALTGFGDSATYWLALQGSAKHYHHDARDWDDHDKHVRFDNGDDVSGGEGNDILFGQGGDDRLRGDSGADWLIGGDGKDDLDGGPDKDIVKSGNDSSKSLRSAVAARMIDWNQSFRNFGLPFSPFGGVNLGKDSGQPNVSNFDFLTYETPKPGDDD